MSKQRPKTAKKLGSSRKPAAGSAKPKRKGVNGRSKGKRGEYLVRDAMALWYGVEFHRTPGSGSHSTVTNQADMAGDIYCKDPTFPYSVEVKNVENWTIEGLLKDKKSPLLGYWDQTLRQADRAVKAPLLCFTKARAPLYCMALEKDLPNDFKGHAFHFKGDIHVVIFLLKDLVLCDPFQWRV